MEARVGDGFKYEVGVDGAFGGGDEFVIFLLVADRSLKRSMRECDWM